MDDGKKNKSLILSLFQKFKESQSSDGTSGGTDLRLDPGQQTPVEQPGPGQQTEDQPSAFVVPESIENGGAEEASDPGDEIEEIPDDMKHLLPIYELYTYLCDHGTALQPIGSVRDFESRLHRILYEIPGFDSQLKSLHDFEEELALVCSLLKAKLAPVRQPKDSDTEEEETEVIPPADASLHVKLFENKMYAVIFAIPAQEGGKQLDAEILKAVLAKEHIVYGINQKLLTQIAEEGMYLQFVIAARGSLPIPGTDGYIEDKTKCRKPMVVHEDEHGNADFKKLDRYEDVAKGQVICELIPSIDGVSGSDVCGKVLYPPSVKNPAFSSGRNTIISENKLQLLAAVAGYVSYKNDRYNVDPVLEINGNVDYSVGNIDFSGDVVISGDVSFGFTVKAQGNIIVRGMVEGAELIADGDITIKKGMNGNNSGSLNAKGEVRASYLENCSVHSGGALYADSIISCDIFCDDAVYLEGGRGIIIGGSITALKGVEARMIGSKSQRETTIILGETPHLVVRKKEIKVELAELQNVLEKLKMNFNYLNKLRGTLPPDKLSILNQLEEQGILYEQRKQELEQTLLELVQRSTDFSHCYINSNMVFPITKIVIGECSTNINMVLSKCHIYMSEGEIKIGTL